MLSYCTDNKKTIDAVIAYKVDRISRNIADYSNIKVRLKKYNIIIKSVTEYFEDTPAGRFMENIISNVSQFDNEVRTERSVGGMKEAVQEGRYVWRAPLGYSNVRIDTKATIAPNEMASLVKEAFDLIISRNYSTEVIRLMMHEKGLADKNGNAIGRSYFFRLIRNPLYKGVIKKLGITVNGTYPTLVSAEQFDEVQAILKGRKNKIKHYLKENPDFPLRRFIINNDGKQLTGYWSMGKKKKYPYYSFHLPGTTIRKEELEQKFMDLLAEYAFDTQHLKMLKKILEKHFGKKSGDDEIANIAIEKRIGEINQQIDTLINLHGQGSISESIFSMRIKRLENELEELEDLLKTKSDENVNIPDLLKYAAKVLKAPHLFWKNSPIDIKRRFQVFDFPNGVLFDGLNLRTPKIRSIYKLKELFDLSKFPRVNSRVAGKNTVSTTNFPHSKIDLLNTKGFWEDVVSDLQQLESIIGLENKKTPNISGALISE